MIIKAPSELLITHRSSVDGGVSGRDGSPRTKDFDSNKRTFYGAFHANGDVVYLVIVRHKLLAVSRFASHVL